MEPAIGTGIGVVATLLKVLPFGSFLKKRKRLKMNPRAHAMVEDAKKAIREKGSVTFEAGGGPEQNDLLTAIDWLKDDGYTHLFLNNQQTRGLPQFIVRAGG